MTHDQSAFLRLLQITDSGFPTGGYAFSHGLESLTLLGDVRDAENVRAFAQTQIEETLARLELPAVGFGFHSASDRSFESLQKIDEAVDLLKVVPIYRQASRKLGRRLLESSIPIVGGQFGSEYFTAVETNRMHGHHSVVFGVIAYEIGVTDGNALLAYASSSVNGYVAAAVRLGIIGQRAAQAIIAELHPAIIAAIDRAPRLDIDELGSYSPMIDLAGLSHASHSARQFTS
ncbi:urease accessory UreF family protein [soil metagenome]